MLGGGLSKMNVSTLVLLLDSVFDSDSWVAFHWERLNPKNFMGIHFFGNFKCELGERNITSENYSIKKKKTTLTAVHCRDSHAVLHKDSQAGNRQLPNTSTFFVPLH